MVCPSCQRVVPDNAVFCPFCGGHCQVTPPPPPAGQSPVCTPPAYVPTPPAQPRHPVIEAARGVILSPLFLVALIALSVALVLTLAATGEVSASMVTAMQDVFENMGEDMTEVTEAFSAMGATSGMVGTISGSIPSVLLLIGLWMTYASAKKNQPTINTSGMTLVWVMQILSLVGVCIASGVVLLMVIILAVVGGLMSGEISSAGPEAELGFAVVGVVLVLALLLLAAVFAFAIVYAVKQMKTVNTARQTLMTAVPSDKISSLVIVMAFISGGMNALGSLTALILTPLTALSSLASAAASILFGVVALRYRTAMRQFMPAAPVPPPPPVPYVAAAQVYGQPYEGVSIPPENTPEQ